MKQTIAELGIGGEGWIIYDNLVLPKRVIHVEVLDNWVQDDKLKTLMPRYLLREHIESNGVQRTRDLAVFANEIVYSTKEEAESELHEQVSNTITSIEQESVDWEKVLKDLTALKGQFDNAIMVQKEDLATFVNKLNNIANPQSDNIDWKQVRINASISILNSLLETTKHSVLEAVALKDIYARVAVMYADSLIEALEIDKEGLKKWFSNENIFKSENGFLFKH